MVQSCFKNIINRRIACSKYFTPYEYIPKLLCVFKFFGQFLLVKIVRHHRIRFIILLIYMYTRSILFSKSLLFYVLALLRPFKETNSWPYVVNLETGMKTSERNRNYYYWLFYEDSNYSSVRNRNPIPIIWEVSQ